jgi:hypothetical protein
MYHYLRNMLHDNQQRLAVERVWLVEQGIKQDQEKVRLELISPAALESLGRVLTFGAKKYAARNWEKGIAWSRIVGAILRHTLAIMRGELVDPETGEPHAAHIMCESMFLTHFFFKKPETNDLGGTPE